MGSIVDVKADMEFDECVRTLSESLCLERVMLTGGEPMIHPDLMGIIRTIDISDISITSNGIRKFSVDEWVRLKGLGLGMAVISIHSATPESLIQLETRDRDYTWASKALNSQKDNLVSASQAGLRVRVNTVAHHSAEQTFEVLRSLADLQVAHQFEIRLLNDLANVRHSQQVIAEVCRELNAERVSENRRAGSSNATVRWKSSSGFEFSTKTAIRYFFDPVCGGCVYRHSCHEGFYGVRLERRENDYYVRLCIYKHTPDVLMPWRSFLRSDPSKLLKEVCVTEQAE